MPALALMTNRGIFVSVAVATTSLALPPAPPATFLLRKLRVVPVVVSLGKVLNEVLLFCAEQTGAIDTKAISNVRRIQRGLFIVYYSFNLLKVLCLCLCRAGRPAS